MTDYINIPVSEAELLALRYQKQVVLIVAIDDVYDQFQFTTYGCDADSKIRAARLSEEFARFLGCDTATEHVHEDFRRHEEAAKNKEELDRLRREDEKLRDALREIAKLTGLATAARIAREALKDTPNG